MSSAPTPAAPARYNFRETEAKWQKAWDDEKLFETKNDDPRPKYYVLEMFPYPSGRIHMGHVRNYAMGDVVARWRRAMGRYIRNEDANSAAAPMTGGATRTAVVESHSGWGLSATIRVTPNTAATAASLRCRNGRVASALPTSTSVGADAGNPRCRRTISHIAAATASVAGPSG